MEWIQGGKAPPSVKIPDNQYDFNGRTARVGTHLSLDVDSRIKTPLRGRVGDSPTSPPQSRAPPLLSFLGNNHVRDPLS